MKRQALSVEQGLIPLTGSLLCLFFGFMIAGQITAFFGIFRLVPVLTLGIACTLAAILLYFRWDEHQFLPALRNRSESPLTWRWLNAAAYLAAFAILLLLIILPLARWPFSPISDVIHWDAGAYHFPKAIELFKSGTYWDLSIPYGEYPNGFESLLALSLLLTGSEALFGTIHALIALLSFLVIWSLTWRYTRLPGGFAALVIAIVFISGKMITAGNPFWVFANQVFMIGKNDLLVSTAVLAAALHAPFGPAENRLRYHLPGLVFSSALILMTKPIGIYAAVFIWLPVIWGWLRPLWSRPRGKLPWKSILFCVLVFIPAAAWIGRNLSVIRTIFAPGDWEMAGWSIAANLTNPYFYNYLPALFLFVLATVVLFTVLSVWRKLPDQSLLYLLLALFAAFALTPQTAFFNNTQQPTSIGWRMGMSLLALIIVLYLVIFEPIIQKILSWITSHRMLNLSASLVVCAVAGGLLWVNRGLLTYLPGNDIVLRDQFRESVGVDGYFSAYDYVRQNIHNSVIQIDEGLMYYVYGENFSNQPTKLQYPLDVADRVPQRDPQYYVTFCTNFWTYEAVECPSTLTSPDFLARWQLLYADDYGRVYKRAGQ